VRLAGLVLGGACVSLLLSLTVSLLVPERFRASTEVRAEWESGAAPGEASIAAELTERRLNAVRQRVLARAEGMAATASVRTGGADTFVIECVHADRSKAAGVCNGLALLLVEDATRERASDAEGDLQALETQVAGARRAMDEKAEALRRFRAGAAGDSEAGHQAVDAKAPRAGEELGRLARDYDDAWDAYRALLDRWQAADTALRLGRGGWVRFTVLRAAVPPLAPFYPNRFLFALIGTALGLVVSLGAAIVVERRDPSIRGPEDLEELLGKPILAQIPLVRVRRSRWTVPARRRSHRA